MDTEVTVMYEPKLQEDLRCPMEFAMHAFGGKWKSRIICLLALKGTLRYKEIREGTPGITDNMLAGTLKDLMQADLIRRTQYNEMPLRVEYSLTDKGESLLGLLHTICDWAVRTYGEDIRPGADGCPYVKG